jgi:hypothetical protein
VSNKPDHRGEHVISRKVHYAGKVGLPPLPCMFVCVFLHNFAHETAGAACIRLSLHPLLKRVGRSPASLGRIAPRDRKGVSLAKYFASERVKTLPNLRPFGQFGRMSTNSTNQAGAAVP